MTRCAGLLLVAAALVAAAPVPPTSAAEPKRPSAALRAYGLDWIQYIPEKSLPPTRYAVCIVDTGVAITPDTPPDNPNGPIIKRLSIDGGSGEPQGTTPQHLHGTRMAMTAVAPRNGWGMVGSFPQGRIISVRATVDGESTFRPQAYTVAIDACLREARSVPLAAINLSIGCEGCAVSERDLSALDEAVKRAALQTIPVVVAAGNVPGPLTVPAGRQGVLPVAAGGLRGRMCRYASRDHRVFAVAPACPLPGADPLSGAVEPRADGGSSAAAVQLSTLIAAIRTLRPDVDSATVVSWIAGSRRSKGGLKLLDGRRAARAASVTRFVRR